MILAFNLARILAAIKTGGLLKEHGEVERQQSFALACEEASEEVVSDFACCNHDLAVPGRLRKPLQRRTKVSQG